MRGASPIALRGVRQAPYRTSNQLVSGYPLCQIGDDLSNAGLRSAVALALSSTIDPPLQTAPKPLRRPRFAAILSAVPGGRQGAGDVRWRARRFASSGPR